MWCKKTIEFILDNYLTMANNFNWLKWITPISERHRHAINGTLHFLLKNLLRMSCREYPSWLMWWIWKQHAFKIISFTTNSLASTTVPSTLLHVTLVWKDIATIVNKACHSLFGYIFYYISPIAVVHPYFIHNVT